MSAAIQLSFTVFLFPTGTIKLFQFVNALSKPLLIGSSTSIEDKSANERQAHNSSHDEVGEESDGNRMETANPSQISRIAAYIRGVEYEKMCNDKWLQVAAVIDRVFFILSVLYITISTAIFYAS